MDTSDLLMSSQQQAAEAEQRRPGGFHTGDLGSLSIHAAGK